MKIVQIKTNGECCVFGENKTGVIANDTELYRKIFLKEPPSSFSMGLIENKDLNLKRVDSPFDNILHGIHGINLEKGIKTSLSKDVLIAECYGNYGIDGRWKKNIYYNKETSFFIGDEGITSPDITRCITESNDIDAIKVYVKRFLPELKKLRQVSDTVYYF